MTLREKWTADYLDLCTRFAHLLTPWESEFIASVKRQDANRLTAKQWNRLKEIAEKICAEVA